MGTIADDMLRGAKAIADYLGFGIDEVYYLKRTGDLPTFKIGRRRTVLARKSELDQAFSSRGLSGGGI